MEKIKKHIIHENEKKYKWVLSKLRNNISKPVLHKNKERLDRENIKTTYMIWKNIDNSRKNMSELLGLNSKFQNNIIIKSSKKYTFWIDRIYINTFNDNWINIDLETFWDDSWKTFWFNLWWDFNSWEGNYNLDIDLNHYTIWEKFTYDREWIRNWAETNFDDSTRIDQLDLWIKKEIISIEDNYWSWINIRAWAWIQAIWNFWWEKIQKGWHNATNVYEHKAKYENVNWLTIDIRADMIAKKYLLWSKENWFYINGRLNTKLALSNKYWEINVWWKLWVWAEFAWINVELWYSGLLVYWPKWSTTIKWSMFNNDMVSWKYIELWTKIPFFDNTSLKYRYEDNRKGNDYMTVWIEYKF